MLASRLLKELTPELQDLAEELEVSYSAIKFWKSGDRTPNATNKRKLAELADEKADRLLTLAGRLRNEAKRSEE